MAAESWYGRFYIGHLHVTERQRIREGRFNSHEREMLASDQDPWEKFRNPLPPDLHPPSRATTAEQLDALHKLLPKPKVEPTIGEILGLKQPENSPNLTTQPEQHVLPKVPEEPERPPRFLEPGEYPKGDVAHTRGWEPGDPLDTPAAKVPERVEDEPPALAPNTSNYSATDLEILKRMRPSSRHLFEKPGTSPQERARIWQGAKKLYEKSQQEREGLKDIESPTPPQREPAFGKNEPSNATVWQEKLTGGSDGRPDPQGSKPISKVVAGGLFALFVGFVGLALQAFGFMTVNWGHVYMGIATLVGILIICSEVVPGKPTRHKLRWSFILIVFMVVIDLVMWRIAKARLLSESPTQQAEPQQSISRPLANPSIKSAAIDITPEQLVGFYKKYSTAQADQIVKTYIGQPLKTSGVVSDVERFGDDVRLLLLVKRVDGWTLYGVSARFDDQRWKDRAVAFGKGESVTVVGKLLGVSEASILLEHCEIIE